jgi:hypothetical protein
MKTIFIIMQLTLLTGKSIAQEVSRNITGLRAQVFLHKNIPVLLPISIRYERFTKKPKNSFSIELGLIPKGSNTEFEITNSWKGTYIESNFNFYLNQTRKGFYVGSVLGFNFIKESTKSDNSSYWFNHWYLTVGGVTGYRIEMNKSLAVNFHAQAGLLMDIFFLGTIDSDNLIITPVKVGVSFELKH